MLKKIRLLSSNLIKSRLVCQSDKNNCVHYTVYWSKKKGKKCWSSTKASEHVWLISKHAGIRLLMMYIAKISLISIRKQIILKIGRLEQIYISGLTTESVLNKKSLKWDFMNFWKVSSFDNLLFCEKKYIWSEVLPNCCLARPLKSYLPCYDTYQSPLSELICPVFYLLYTICNTTYCRQVIFPVTLYLLITELTWQTENWSVAASLFISKIWFNPSLTIDL